MRNLYNKSGGVGYILRDQREGDGGCSSRRNNPKNDRQKYDQERNQALRK